MLRTDRRIRVVIAGAGYGGLAAARALSGHARDVDVTVIDQNAYHLLQYQLPEAASGKIDARSLAVPVADLLPATAHFRQARIGSFDFERRTVRTDAGEVAYDHLIIALGGQPATFDIPGLDQHALTLKSLGDARRINGHIETTLARAAALPAGQARVRLLTFAIAGAGITGVELAAELAEALPGRAREYGLDPGEVRIVLLDAAPTILQGMRPETIAEAASALRQLGVTILLRSAVAAAKASAVALEGHRAIPADTLVWTGGVRASQLVLDAGLTLAGRGAAVVDPFLRSVDHPNVTIIGDSALVRDPRTGVTALPCAQLAVKQGQYAAKDLLSELRGGARSPYVPRMQGLLISLGGRRGVGTIGPIWVRRLIARLAKVGAETRYLWTIGGARMVAARWLWLRAEWVHLARRLRPLRRRAGGLAAGAK